MADVTSSTDQPLYSLETVQKCIVKSLSPRAVTYARTQHLFGEVRNNQPNPQQTPTTTRRSARVRVRKGDGEEGDAAAEAPPAEGAEQQGATPERPSTPESSGVGTVPGRPRRGVAAVGNGGGGGGGGGSSSKDKNRKGGSQERVALSMEVRVRRTETCRLLLSILRACLAVKYC